MKKVIAGMDLHSNNVVIGIMDMDGKRLASRKLPCELKEVVKFLTPFKKRLERVAVESTYNWYWLVDGLRALKYPVVLANPAGMEQYSGIKHADDTNDAFFLAELLRLAILPTGHIYDAELRPVRDLLRRRLMLVHQRTSLMLSFKSLYTRTTGQEMTLSALKNLEIKEAQELYEHPANQTDRRDANQAYRATDREHREDREGRAELGAGAALLREAGDAAGSGKDSGHDHHDGGGRH